MDGSVTEEIFSCCPPPSPPSPPSVSFLPSRGSASAELLVLTSLVAGLPRLRLVRWSGSGRNWPPRIPEISGCTKLAIARRVRYHAMKSVPSNLMMLRMSWMVAAVDSMMNVDFEAHLFRNLREMRMDLRRTRLWRKSQSRTIKLSLPMNAMTLEKRRCRCDVFMSLKT